MHRSENRLDPPLVVSEAGIMPDPAKIEAVNNISSPRNIKDIRSFLGLAGYYHKFIPGFSSIAAPLLQLTQKASSFIWKNACKQAFQRLKQLLCSAPILAYPDFGKDFVLQTDASDYGVGAVLSQLDDSGNEKVIAYASKASRNTSQLKKKRLPLSLAQPTFAYMQMRSRA